MRVEQIIVFGDRCVPSEHDASMARKLWAERNPEADVSRVDISGAQDLENLRNNRLLRDQYALIKYPTKVCLWDTVEVYYRKWLLLIVCPEGTQLSLSSARLAVTVVGGILAGVGIIAGGVTLIDPSHAKALTYEEAVRVGWWMLIVGMLALGAVLLAVKYGAIRRWYVRRSVRNSVSGVETPALNSEMPAKRDPRNRKRITHLLVLHSRRPNKDETLFVREMLNVMSVDGEPKWGFVDEDTKIHFLVVGPQEFDEAYITNMALVHFRSLWNVDVAPFLREIQYSRFSGPEGKGTTIENWQGH